MGFDGDGLTLGSMINVMYVDDQILNPFVQEISFEYDNPDSLSFTFGNKFNLGTSEYTLGKIFSDNTSTVQRVQRSLIGTSTTSSSSGSNTDRNNSSAMASTNDAIENINGVTSDIIKKAEDTAKEFNDKLTKQYNELDAAIDRKLSDAKTEIYEAIEKIPIEEQISNHVQKVSSVIAGGLGLYTTVLGDKDTGFRYCFHDGYNMSTSFTYYYASTGGFATATFSTPGNISETSILDGKTVDGDYIRWNSAIDRNGDMVIRDLSANKIMADQLAANCISAVNIVSSGIKANEILVPGTITGNYIKANSIYASNLREDIMCKELWRNPNPTSSFSEQSVYSQVSGVSFADYTAAFIFCTNGAASCIVLRGTATTMVSKSFTSGSTQTGWFWGTWSTDYDSYSAR